MSDRQCIATAEANVVVGLARPARMIVLALLSELDALRAERDALQARLSAILKGTT